MFQNSKHAIGLVTIIHRVKWRHSNLTTRSLCCGVTRHSV